MASSSVTIGGCKIGFENPVFIIAEAGLNHGGDLDLAIQMVRACASTGAQAIKFQAFSTDERFGPDEQTKQLVRPAEFHETDFKALRAACIEEGLIFFSTAFDTRSAELLVRLESSAIKIASCDVLNLKLLDAVAQQGLPVILSRGTANEAEIGKALDVLARHTDQIVLLHCVSSYPMADVDANLGAIRTLSEKFSFPIGYSDHSIGIEVPVSSVYAGACAIEKHYTLDRSRKGIDWEISCEPAELAALVEGARRAAAIRGSGRLEPMASETEEIEYRNSLRVSSL